MRRPEMPQSGNTEPKKRIPRPPNAFMRSVLVMKHGKVPPPLSVVNRISVESLAAAGICLNDRREESLAGTGFEGSSGSPTESTPRISLLLLLKALVGPRNSKEY